MAHVLATRNQRPTSSPIAMLFWEEWRQTRARMAALFVMFVLAGWSGMLVATIARLFNESAPNIALTEFSTMLAIWLGAAVAGVLLFSYYGRNDLQFAFPVRLFSLPVRTETLVAVRMTYAAVVTGILYSVCGIGIHATSSEVISPELYPMVAISFIVYIQACSWLTGRFNTAAVVVVGCALAYPVASALHMAIVYLPETLRLRTVYVLGPFWVLCYVVAVAAVTKHRHGSIRSLWPSRMRQWWADATNANSGTWSTGPYFATPNAAQQWFELRRLIRLLLLCVIGLVAPIFVSLFVNFQARFA